MVYEVARYGSVEDYLIYDLSTIWGNNIKETYRLRHNR